MFRNFKHHLFRSPYQSLAAVFVIFFSFFLISVFFLLGTGAHSILKYFESRPQIIAYLKDDASTEKIELLKAKIQATNKAKEIKFVTKEQALELYRQLFKDKPVLLEMVTAKILPASLEISPSSLESIEEIVEILRNDPIVEDLDYEEDVIANLQKIVAFLRKVGIIVAGFLLGVSILTLLVVLGMKIFQRKEEIEILKLLGASGWYIYAPLYLEGIFYGIIAAFFSWGASYLLLTYASPFLKSFFTGVPLFPISWTFLLEFLGGLVFLGVLVGFLGSFFAILRSSRSVR